VLTADPSPASILDLSLRHGVTRTFIVPTVLRNVLEELQAQSIKLRTLRGIHYGASVIDLSLLREAMRELGCGFMQYYGMTEITGTATILGPDDHDIARPQLLRSVGRPVPGVEIEIRDPAKRSCALGVSGEIWIRTETLMAGYAGLPEATA
jgi:acyl-CoA synthetase (AMP-forming)/AMP-acid ligase II